jgi:integrase/recombinase XerD
MATNRLLFETQKYLTEIPQQIPTKGFCHSQNHICLIPDNQAASYLAPILIVKQTSQLKIRHNFLSKDGLSRILLKLWQIEVPGKDHVESYLRDQYRRNFRLNSIKNMLNAIASFLVLVQQDGKNCLEEITRADLGAFIEHMQDRGLKASTVRTRLESLKGFIRYQVDKGVISSDVLLRRMIIKVPDPLPKAMEMEDEAKLLSVIDDIRNRAMIVMLLRTGMRIGELLNTQVGDVNLVERKIEIWEAQKSRVGRVVYFSDDARDALKAWYYQRDPQKPFVFYAMGRDTLTYAGARVMFCKYLEKANLSHKGYTLHCLRHTNASSLLNAGIPLECLRELLGHHSVEATRRYARLTNRTREKEYFKAMGKIERGEIDGYYKLDLELQEILEKKKLLSQNSKKLHEQS